MGALLWLVSRRFVLRDAPAGKRLRGLQVGSALVTVGSAALIGFGSPSVWQVGLLAVATLVLVASTVLRALAPALAVCVLGVCLSCASLSICLGVIRGFEVQVLKAASTINGHVLLTKYGLDFFEYPDVSATVMADERIVAASPFAYSMVALVAVDEELADVDVPPTTALAKGLDPKAVAGFTGFRQAFGAGDLSALRPGDSRHLPGLVLGVRLARALRVGPGDHVRVVVPAEIDGTEEAGRRPPRHATFEVLDTVRTGSSDLDGQVALMHLTAGQALFFREGRVTGIEFELRDPREAKQVAKAIEAKLPDHYRTSTWEDTNQALVRGLRQIRATLSVLLGLLMLVAAASVVSSLLLVVRRKQAEIGTLLAVGADEKVLFWIFESIGIGVGLLGAAAGEMVTVIVGWGLRYARFPLDETVYPVDHLPMLLETPAMVLPALAAVLLCAAASGPVALLATRTPLLQALQRA